MPNLKTLALWVGPVSGALLFVLMWKVGGLSYAASMTAGITLWTAIWWVLEPVPIPAASLVPFSLLPLTGVLTHKQAAAAFGDPMVLLMMGGFILSTAMENSGAHRRVAMSMVRLVGGQGGRRVVLGFMIASAGLSMWISNTATVLMLLPVAMAVLAQSRDDRLHTPLLLGVAYGASIGGVGTPVGTPPNVIFMGVYNAELPDDQKMTFAGWMRIGVPIVVVFLPIAWLWLTRRLKTTQKLEIPPLGRWTAAEVRVLCVFALTALLWIFRAEPRGGWSHLIGVTGFVDDSTVALLMAAVMFVVPDGRGGRLLDWHVAERIPWGILLLFGGGICIAQAFIASGLSTTVGQGLSMLAGWPIVLLIFVICLGVTFLTEVTSNTATATLLMPIFAAAAVAAELPPALLMVPAAISASYGFMLPVGTPPNAIVFSTGRVPMRTMASEGFALNLMGAVVITLLCYFILR